MWKKKEKLDKYYPVAIEQYSKKVIDEDQMQTIHSTKVRSAEIYSNKEKDDYDL